MSDDAELAEPVDVTLQAPSAPMQGQSADAWPDPAEDGSGGDNVEALAQEPIRADERTVPADARTRLLLGPAPTAAGEDPAEFSQLMAALEADYPDAGDGGVCRRWHLETAALKILTLRRGTRAERGAWNAATADALLRLVVDRAGVQVLDHDCNADVKQTDEAIELTFPQSWWRDQTRICRAAVAGDTAALEQVKKKLGSGGALETDGAIDFVALYDVLFNIARVVRPAQDEAEHAFRLLEKRKKCAAKKQKVETTVPCADREVLDLRASKETSATEQLNATTNAPTVIAPRAGGGADGAA